MVMPVPDVMTMIPVCRRRYVIRRVSDRTGINPEHALDPSNDAANGRSDDSADRPGDAAALLEPVRCTPRNTLRLRR
jgi:hypothetical protein